MNTTRVTNPIRIAVILEIIAMEVLIAEYSVLLGSMAIFLLSMVSSFVRIDVYLYLMLY